jgi:hypothetical protein
MLVTKHAAIITTGDKPAINVPMQNLLGVESGFAYPLPPSKKGNHNWGVEQWIQTDWTDW